MMTPSERRDTVQVLVRRGISQRKALRYLGLSRRIASYAPRQAAKDQAVAERLRQQIAATADPVLAELLQPLQWQLPAPSDIGLHWALMGAATLALSGLVSGLIERRRGGAG